MIPPSHTLVPFRHAVTRHPFNAPWRRYSGTTQDKPRSPHAQWYADIAPSMIPIFLLGSAVYLGLQLAQANLSHEKYMDEADHRIKALEAEMDDLQKQRAVRKTPDIPSGTASPPAESKLAKSWWKWF